MSPTPAIPNWIRNFRDDCGKFTNIYEICPGETRLYGTESLYGDWDGQLLLLAQDFAPVALVKQRLRDGDYRPYHHTCWRQTRREIGAKTNKKLSIFLDQIKCGKLYGSALANLLKNEDYRSGGLQVNPNVKKFMEEVLNFTIDKMPNLRAIACLGSHAVHLVENCRIKNWPTRKNIRAFSMFHPAARISDEKAIGRWKPLYEFFTNEFADPGSRPPQAT
jgi:hypothetical protein